MGDLRRGPAEPGSVGDSRAAGATAAAATDLADALEEEALAELLEAEALAALEEAEAENLAEAIDTADLPPRRAICRRAIGRRAVAEEPSAEEPSTEPRSASRPRRRSERKRSAAPHNNQATVAETASEPPTTDRAGPSPVDDAAGAGADVDPPAV